MTYQLSAPRQSGYEESFETREATRAKAADILGIAVEEMIEIKVGGENTTYCYASQEDADNDDGAYAVQYRQIC